MNWCWPVMFKHTAFKMEAGWSVEKCMAWWWNHTKPAHLTVYTVFHNSWNLCSNAKPLTDAEHAELIPILDDFLLALEYARNPPYGD